MKISKIEAFGVRYTPRDSFSMASTRTLLPFDGTLVKITTDEGIVGWGEQSPFPSYMAAYTQGTRAALTVLGPEVIGLDPRQVAVVYERMRTVLKAHAYARSAIDIACWDILGKASALSVADLLGGAYQLRFPVLHAIGIDTPERMQEAAEVLVAAGYRRVQVKVGGDWAADVKRAKACLEALGAMDVVIFDANGGWSRTDAVRFVSDLASNAFIEQPCRSIAECASVRRSTRCLMILDESLTNFQTVHECLTQDLIDGAMLKLSRFGGITPLRRIRDLCEEWEVPMIIQDGGGGDIVSAASAHLAASTRPANLLSGSLVNIVVREEVATVAPRHDGGYGSISDAPGLGIVVDESRLGEPVFAFGQ